VTVFGDYSKYYDLLYSKKEYEKEVEFVDFLLSKYNINQCGSILELGSGTGRHAFYLARKGYKIDGVDQSATMLEMAGDFLSQCDSSIANKIVLSQGDIRTLRTGKKYDAVISLFHVMSYQTTNSDLEAVFQTVKEHVRSEGLFIFDVWYGPAVLTQLPTVRHKKFENANGIVERIAVPTLNENHNTVQVDYHLFVQEKRNDIYPEESFVKSTFYKVEEQHKMRYLFLPEIESLCEKFGMKLEHACEWLTGETLSRHTWGACFVVKT
jgi:SAM-dependent methyltransferase